MAPSRRTRGPAKGVARDRGAQSLRALAEKAERDRSEPAEQARLLRRAADGDGEAERALFDENLNMVLRAARAHAGAESHLSEDELVQEGSIGLLSAIKSFPASGRDDFRAYAEEQVGVRMEAAQAEQASVQRRLRQLVVDAEAYERAEIAIRREKGREATEVELAEKLEWPADKTRLLGEMVREARRRHDEELLEFVDPEELFEIDGDG